MSHLAAKAPTLLNTNETSNVAVVSWNAHADHTIEIIQAFEKLWPGSRYKVTANLPEGEIAGGEGA